MARLSVSVNSKALLHPSGTYGVDKNEPGNQFSKANMKYITKALLKDGVKPEGEELKSTTNRRRPLEARRRELSKLSGGYCSKET